MAAMRQSWTDDRLDDLRMEMRAGFARTEQLIEQHTKQVEQRFELLEKSIDQRFDQVDRRFGQVDQRFQSIEGQISSLDQRLQRVEGKFDPLVYSIVGLAAAMFIAMAGLFAAIVF